MSENFDFDINALEQKNDTTSLAESLSLQLQRDSRRYSVEFDDVREG